MAAEVQKIGTLGEHHGVMPANFCEHETHPCLFCKKTVHIGHDADGQQVVLHETPTCDVFQHCDDVRQFALFSALQVKADIDKLDRN